MLKQEWINSNIWKKKKKKEKKHTAKVYAYSSGAPANVITYCFKLQRKEIRNCCFFCFFRTQYINILQLLTSTNILKICIVPLEIPRHNMVFPAFHYLEWECAPTRQLPHSCMLNAISSNEPSTNCTIITMKFALWFSFDILYFIFFTLLNNYDKVTIIQKKKKCIYILTSGNN